MEEINIELYKSLKDEYKQFSFYVQTLTMMKFIAIASIISFYIVDLDAFNLQSENLELISVGILMIPIVCFFLDLKILEMTLFLRSVSKFLAEKYKKTYIQEWENYVWSKNFLTITRSILTIFSSVGMSFLILWASLILVGKFVISSWWNYCFITGLIFSIIGITFSCIILKKIWFN